jgi:hypothetical protein
MLPFWLDVAPSFAVEITALLAVVTTWLTSLVARGA